MLILYLRLVACGSSNPSNSSKAKWLAMSVVNGTSGSFNYPGMGLAGWLCASSAAGSCTPSQGCPNNSAAEGNQFFLQFTSASQALNYKVTGITNCQGPEGVGDGQDPDPGNLSGEQAIVNHLVAQCKHPSPH